MKTSVKLGGLIAAALIATSGASFAAPVNPYVVSSSNQVVMDPFGLCWRTNFWTPALAEAQGMDGDGCKCDKDVLSAGACASKGIPAPVVKAGKVSLAADTLFDFDRATLKAEGQAMLDELVSRMAGMDVEVVLATGYTDRLGKEAYNQKLSERRAAAVKTYLVSKGVSANAIKTAGKGEADPVVNCPNPSKKGEIKNFKQLVACLQPNRRAVIEVKGSRTVK